MISSNELYSDEKSISEYIMEEIENIDKQTEELHNMSLKERKFAIFKMFYNGINENLKKLLEEATMKYPFILTGIHPIIEKANDALLNKRISLYNREEVGVNIITSYKDLLKKISKLSQELNINNSLELSILFSYLLWNGYLSKDKSYKFQSSNRANLSGMLFADVANGIGVCINNSDMLKDVLNESGYNSCVLVNNLNSFLDVCSIYVIKRNGVIDNKNIIKEIMNIRKANHAFNLIEEQGKIYAYDSTNLLLYNIDCQKYASLVNGFGKNMLFPYDSYSYCVDEKEVSLLDKLLAGKYTPKIYTNEDYISVGTVNLDIIKNSSQLLEDFYTDAHQDIINISKEIDKNIKQRQRTK